MEYRVGIQCVSTQIEADDLILSTTPPTITTDGQLIRPVRKNDGWYLNQHKIQLSHPECDVGQQIQNGLEVGSGLLMVSVSIFCFRIIAKMIKNLGDVGGSDDS